MKVLSRTAIALAGAACFAAALGTGVAHAASQDGTYCALLVGKATGDASSPLLGKVCSDVSLAQAESGLRATRSLRDSVTIMYWYENVDYIDYAPSGGGAMATIIGDDGPCDAAGYRVEPGSWWSKNLTSLACNNSCYTARVYNRAVNDADDFSIYVGGRGHWLERFNDNVGRIQVHS
ncbi:MULTISPECIES: hypothetical protein [Amycolatopsis]|uniref:Uncharacterized protein n=1 Tax=Amycolatopsis bullii TaxID=941987 RepID=A0ABQ3JYN1_9PSEU|nr:hypothetical protein [Amycolatopsis bullii]GHF94088.1 hypothetical protein GCM10017567_05700 [Amycolatopsis bullii]